MNDPSWVEVGQGGAEALRRAKVRCLHPERQRLGRVDRCVACGLIMQAAPVWCPACERTHS